MTFQLVAFDFDGTLADSFGCFLRGLNETAKTHGFCSVAPEEIDELRGMRGQQILRHLKIPFWKTRRIAAAMRRYMHEHISEVELFPGVSSMLHELSRAGVAIGIVTSNSHHNVCTVLGPKNQELIRFWECDIGLLSKRRPLRRMLKNSGVTADAALYVGDETRDAQAADAAGWIFRGVAWGYANAETLQPHSNGLLFQRVEDILCTVTCA